MGKVTFRLVRKIRYFGVENVVYIEFLCACFIVLKKIYVVTVEYWSKAQENSQAKLVCSWEFILQTIGEGINA